DPRRRPGRAGERDHRRRQPPRHAAEPDPGRRPGVQARHGRAHDPGRRADAGRRL
ncbi:MAG: TldE protein, part of TldE/TldD proteolytic complex, partial [uncultured Acetobacteraceae bacterium]